MPHLSLSTSQVISRKTAKQQGLSTYFTGKKCPQGHICNRYVENYGCAACLRSNALNWKDKNPERIKELKRISHNFNYEKYRERKANYYIANKKSAILSMARRRSIKKGLEFNITVDDIEWVTRCPALGIALDYEIRGCCKANSPTLDRLDNSAGYIVGNVNVISYRANALKSNATLLELQMLAAFIARKCGI